MRSRRRRAAHATALYAFCRQADDAVDLGEDGAAELAVLHSRLDLIYARKPLPIAADRAFAEVVATRSIPRELPAALLEGFAWDLAGRRYQTLADLNAYAARVAGTVGAMMAVILGAQDAAVIARACDLGVAMQITNIARDVGEDARRGRLYLPREWLAAAGVDADAWLANPRFSPQSAVWSIACWCTRTSSTTVRQSASPRCPSAVARRCTRRACSTARSATKSVVAVSTP